MSDLIDRQAAVDAILGEHPEARYPQWYAEKIRQLPSIKTKTQQISEDTTFKHKKFPVNLEITKITRHQSDYSDMDDSPSTAQSTGSTVPSTNCTYRQFDGDNNMDDNFNKVDKAFYKFITIVSIFIIWAMIMSTITFIHELRMEEQKIIIETEHE